jgi:hypothetical protein
MDNERRYAGSGKQVQGYNLVNFYVNLDDLQKSDIKTSKSGNKYVNLTIGERKNGADDYGNTHSVWIDTYEKQEGTAAAPAKATNDDLPF